MDRVVSRLQDIADLNALVHGFAYRDQARWNELAALFGCAVNELDWSRNDRAMGFLHLPHLLLSNDVRIAVAQSADAHGYTVEGWRDERKLRRLHRAARVTADPHEA